jgi:hypothetical protein
LVSVSELNQALSIANDLIKSDTVGVLVIDLPPTWSPSQHDVIFSQTAWQKLTLPLAKSTCVCVVLLSISTNIPVTSVTIRLLIENKAWLYEQGDFVGYLSQITILKNKIAPLAAPLTLSIVEDDAI